MEALFFLSIVVILATVFFIDGTILLWLIKKSNMSSITQSNVYVILLTSLVGAWLVSIPLNLILMNIVPNILLMLISGAVSFTIFYFVLNKYVKAKLFTTWKIYFLNGLAFGVILALFVLIPRVYVYEPFIISGDGMNPTFSSGDYLLAEKISKNYKRGDIIIYLNDEQKFITQRVIGLPNETIEIKGGKILINSVLIEEEYALGIIEEEINVNLSNNEYYLLGDNRLSSADSRTFGPIDSNQIIGKFFLKIDIFSLN